jgi:hypothetical protein
MTKSLFENPSLEKAMESLNYYQTKVSELMVKVDNLRVAAEIDQLKILRLEGELRKLEEGKG